MSNSHWHDNHWHEWHWNGNHWFRFTAPLDPEIERFTLAVYPTVETELEIIETVSVSLAVYPEVAVELER